MHDIPEKYTPHIVIKSSLCFIKVQAALSNDNAPNFATTLPLKNRKGIFIFPKQEHANLIYAIQRNDSNCCNLKRLTMSPPTH